MKKISFIALVFGAASLSVSAQHTTPRIGTGVNVDYRKSASMSYTSITDTTGADSATIAPNVFTAVYRIVLLDSLTLKNPTVTNLYAGDRVQLVISAASGTPKLKFTGSNWITAAGTVTMTTNLRSVVNFVFDGAKLVESGRYTQ